MISDLLDLKFSIHHDLGVVLKQIIFLSELLSGHFCLTGNNISKEKCQLEEGLHTDLATSRFLET